MEELKTGWLSPTGEFFPAGLYDHIYVARELADSLSLPSYDFKTNRMIPDDDKLLNNGWVYIGIGVYFEHEWRIGWKLNRLTDVEFASIDFTVYDNDAENEEADHE